MKNKKMNNEKNCGSNGRNANRDCKNEKDCK